MLPLLPFAAGLVTGAFAIKLWRNDKARETLGTAKDKLRLATAGGLARIESSSAAMRERLTLVETPAATEPPAASAPDSPGGCN